ncbi:MAG TPA: hypothetical protein VMA13_04535, partial [Candidatus Saccharimonadales bacterium]|nr:hypothetical protein [Candidatus Saccharimonadales bacterium]
QIYKLVRPHGPPIPERGVVAFIRNALKEENICDADSQFYKENFSDHLEPIRNNFAHGDWTCLAANLQRLNLTQAFQAVAEHFNQIKTKLTYRGFDV